VLELASLTVDCWTLDYTVVSWSIKPTVENIADYTFSVWRSNSPEGPFKLIQGGLVDTFVYKDPSVNLKHRWRKYYYKIQVDPHNDPHYSPWIGPESRQNRPDTIASEIIRRNDLLLQNFVGIDAQLYIRKTWGQRCCTCWDPIKQRKRESNCPVCYNTSFVGGFFGPIPIRINFSPSPEMIRQANFEQHPDATNAWTSNYPQISAKDIIIEEGYKRWRVVTPSFTQKRRVKVHQVLQLTGVNLNDIEYKLPVIGTE